MKKNKTIIKRCIPVLAALSTVVLLTGCPKDNKIDFDKLSGSELLEALHSKMLEDHQKYVTYSSYQSYEANGSGKTAIDAYGKDTSKLIDFYTGELSPSYSAGNYSREHVWACANSSGLWTHNKDDGSHYVDGTGYKGGGSDLYHIRPAERNINSLRGNAKLYVFEPGETPCYSVPGYDTPYKLKLNSNELNSDGVGQANRFEPADQIKGDMARIVMYVYTHYAAIGDNSSADDTVRSYLGALNFKDIFYSGYSLDKIHQLLVEWNEMDPPDETEQLRNETVEKIQGNRNPFVDHPEYIRKIWMEEE